MTFRLTILAHVAAILQRRHKHTTTYEPTLKTVRLRRLAFLASEFISLTIVAFNGGAVRIAIGGLPLGIASLGAVLDPVPAPLSERAVVAGARGRFPFPVEFFGARASVIAAAFTGLFA